jgi:hypothetical protein
LLVAGGATAGDPKRCGGMSAQVGAKVAEPVTTVRVTLRSRSADGKTVAFCDYKFPPGATPPFLSVPDKGATSLDVFVEAFAPAGMGDPSSADGVRRFATGAIYGIDVNPTTLSALRLYPSEAFACAGTQLVQARAFHTATLLPDGRVLLDGGLVASASDPTLTAFSMEGAYATGGAEVYDPRDQSVHSVNEPTPPAPRAFHAAQLLSGNGPCAAKQLAVLLVGGLTNTPGVGQPILQPSTGLASGRLWPQTPMGALSTPLPARAIGNEVLCLDPDTLAGTRMAIGGKASAQRAAGVGPRGLVAAGGIDYDPTMLNQPTQVAEVASFDQTGKLTAAAVGIGRDGASLTVLNTTSALVWGGGGTSDPIGELLGGLDGTPTSMPVTLVGTPITQFHTATLLDTMGDPSILVTGGFEVVASGLDTQPTPAASAVRLVTVNAATSTVAAVPIGFGGTYVADATCSAPATRYKPAGWESATTLPRGDRILVTGGTPSTAADTTQTPQRCSDCPGAQSLLCAIGQASIYDTANNMMAPTGALSVPRLGHTSTQLLDGSVLVAGGIGADTVGATTSSVFLSDLEVYNSRTVLAPYNASTVLDLDDPIYADLVTAKLQREPAKLAVEPKAKGAARECDTL